MKLTRTILLTSTLALIPAMAAAQSAASTAGKTAAPSTAQGTPTKGAIVYDTSGAVVGTIEAIDNQFATLATTQSKVKLPLSSFAAGPKGPLLGMTAAQVDAAAGAAGAKPSMAVGSNGPTGTPASGATATAGGVTSTAAAATNASPKLEKGTAVSDTTGAPVGTIDSVDGQFATVATSRSKVRLPLTAFAANIKGSGAVISMSAAQLEAAASAATAKSGS